MYRFVSMTVGAARGLVNCSLHPRLLTASSPILDLEVGYLGEVTDIAGDDGEAVQKSNGGNAKVLGADTDALLLQLAKESVSLCVKEKEVPLTEVVDGLNEGGVAVGRLAQVVSVFADISQPALQLFFYCDRRSEEVLAGRASHFRTEDWVRILVVRDGVGVENEHLFASFSLRILAAIFLFARR